MALTPNAVTPSGTRTLRKPYPSPSSPSELTLYAMRELYAGLRLGGIERAEEFTADGRGDGAVGGQVVEVARPAENAVADVLVEVAREPPHGESHLDDRALEDERRARAPRSEREEHVTAGAERRGRAREE